MVSDVERRHGGTNCLLYGDRNSWVPLEHHWVVYNANWTLGRQRIYHNDTEGASEFLMLQPKYLSFWILKGICDAHHLDGALPNPANRAWN